LTYREYNFTSRQWKQITIEPLTERDRAILMLARQGRRGCDIARDLHIGYGTLRQLTTSLYAKLGVKTMQEAIIFASNRCMIFAPEQLLKNKTLTKCKL
jgi:DNA-binding NarL/FixJ family response regulator